MIGVPYRYMIQYVQCINASVQQQCGLEVANVYTTLQVEAYGLYAGLNNCSRSKSHLQCLTECKCMDSILLLCRLVH
jgi:hypothetical protein